MSIKLGLLLAVLTLPRTDSLQAQRSSVPMSSENRVRIDSSAEIQFKLYRGYLIIVEGSLGTLDRLNFLVDTGVSPTKVDSRIAKGLGLAAGPSQMVALFNQNLEATVVVLPALRVGPTRAESLPGMLMDLTSFEAILGVRIDASIGFEVLSRSNFSIDYKSKKIVLGTIEPSSLSVPFNTAPPILTLAVQVQGEVLHLRIDTAAPEIVLFGCQLPSRIRQLPTRSLKRSFFNGAGQEVNLAEVMLPDVRLGSADFGPQESLVTYDRANCHLPFDGVLSVTRLGLKWVGFDFERQRFSWKR